MGSPGLETDFEHEVARVVVIFKVSLRTMFNSVCGAVH